MGIRENENVALFFGYIRKYKGLNVLLDAMKKVLGRINVKLLVVGEFYDDKRNYIRQIVELGLKDNVVVIGDYVPNDEVAKYFSASDVVVLPYVDATQSGIVQIAYNFNRPAITTNVGGLAEVVLNLGLKFSEAVAEQKKYYSWDNLVSAIEELAK